MKVVSRLTSISTALDEVLQQYGMVRAFHSYIVLRVRIKTKPGEGERDGRCVGKYRMLHVL